MRLDVGIGEFGVSARLEDEIKTYALGSCVAVIAYDQERHVAGLIHIALPEAKVNLDKAKKRPGYFADSGLPIFLQALEKQGANRRKLKIKLAGGASIMDENRQFDIGRRNMIAIKRFLWKVGLGVLREDVGGTISRTVRIEVKTGEVTISNAKSVWSL
ncbi:chemotaxis protein CheD [Sediminispirochaeta smaragdinae]|jgi:chemotaxis protein CheD|uniref:Probable chemoreceptor glutamine deamidase CheD n=1 Tax=Sediminispirochaeta smaragdinae (strain DSM 11293 / JCM 15392 / SEBR 4228) TaxID=573413 RepID=E1R3P3_SEDSS|nr:chemotaxis protein CheD [Sediminispirochaeta smaragdinae]ADK82014.1 CheD [Sediminispirochaeta smaragdinae DSM 11293]